MSNLPKNTTTNTLDYLQLREQIMFWLAFSFLSVIALVIHRWASIDTGFKITSVNQTIIALLLACWLVIAIESMLGYFLTTNNHKSAKVLLAILLLPPLRMGFSTITPQGKSYLPFYGWFNLGDQSLQKIETRMTQPMLFFALMILPILGIEFLFKEKIEQWPWMSSLLTTCTAIIWLAFATELIIGISIARRKLRYCKKNWLNIAIVLLPLIAFLRGLRLLQTARLAKASKILRIYRIRSLGLRLYQGLIALDAVQRYVNKNPEKRLEKLNDQLQDKQREIRFIEENIALLEKRISTKDSAEITSKDNVSLN